MANHHPPRRPACQAAMQAFMRVTAAHLLALPTLGWLLLVVLVPLLVNLWGQQPFELPKSVLLRTLVWLLAGSALVTRLLARHSPPKRNVSNPLLGPVLLLALVIVVTTLTAYNWRVSLWGSYARSQGAITLLTYLLLCLLAADCFCALARAQQLLTVMVAASAPLILVSLLQSAGWNPHGLITDARTPAYATLGRANFVGAYLALLTPLTLALWQIALQRGWRSVWLMLLVAQVVTVALTFARSAWLATSVALGCFALLWWGGKLARQWRKVAWSGLGLLTLSGPLTVLWLGPTQLDSVAARLHIWQGVWTLIAQRPLLGYGAEVLGMIFWRVHPPQLVYVQGRDIIVDRAHNLFLDWLVTAGVPGLLAYVLVLITFAVVVWRALHEPLAAPRRALLIGVLAAVVANCVNNFTSFDVTPTAMATWLLLGMGVALAAPVPERVDPPRIRPPSPPRSWQWSLAGVLLLSIVVAVWQVNVRPLQADMAARAAQRAAQAEDWQRAHVAATDAVAHWPLEAAHHILLGHVYWQLALAAPTPARHLVQADVALRQATRLRPADPVVWQQLAQFYSATAHHFGRDTTGLAAEAYQRAVTLAPTHATLYVVWGRAALEQGNVADAATRLRQAVALDRSHGEAYLLLSAAEAQLGRWQVALADAREAVRLLPTSAQAHTTLAHCYWHLAQPSAALRAVAEALRLDPHHAGANVLRQTILAARHE